MGATVACRIKVGDELGLVMALRKSEADVQLWRNRALSSESETEMLEGKVASLTTELKSYKPFAKCETLRDRELIRKGVAAAADWLDGRGSFLADLMRIESEAIAQRVSGSTGAAKEK